MVGISDFVSGAVIALAGAVLGAVLGWRLSFHLARSLRADERREAALVALRDQAGAVSRLAASHALIRSQKPDEPVYIQQNIWIPLENAMSSSVDARHPDDAATVGALGAPSPALGRQQVGSAHQLRNRELPHPITPTCTDR